MNERRQALGLGAVTFDIFRHPGHDPGVYRQVGALLETFADQYRYALVLLDAAWEGSPGDAAKIEEAVQGDLNRCGWRGRSAVIALAPEPEVWVWTNSSHVPTELGMTWRQIRELAEREGYWSPGAAKPEQPKELLEAAGGQCGGGAVHRRGGRPGASGRRTRSTGAPTVSDQRGALHLR